MTSDALQNSAALDEFRKLFWSARASLRAKPQTGDASPYHLAVEFARLRSWPWATDLLEAVRLGFSEQVCQAGELLRRIAIPVEFVGEWHFCLAWVELQLKHWERSIALNRSALDSPNFSQPAKAWLNLGIAQNAQGLFLEAIHSIQCALLLMDGDPEEADVWSILGSSHNALRSFHRAQECFEQALSLKPVSNRDEILCEMGEMYLDRRDYDRAIEHFDQSKALANKSLTARAWSGKGRAYFNKADYETALNCFQQSAEACDPNVPGWLRWNLALSLINTGRREEAKPLLELVLAGPEDSAGLHANAKMLLAQGSQLARKSRSNFVSRWLRKFRD